MAGVEGLVAVGPPVLPKWLLFLRIAIIVLSLAVLIAAAINLATFNNWGYVTSSSGPAGFLVFDAIFTWIILGTMIVFELKFHQFYLRITYVVLLPLCAIFWLSAWAWAASVASAFRGAYNDRFFRDDDLDKYGNSMAACAALGAFTWVAIIVVAIFYITACLRDENSTIHQTEMGMPTKHTTTTTSDPAPGTAAAPAAFNQQTQDYYASQPPQPQQQQGPYGAQEMHSPEQAQGSAPYPVDNTTPYPNQERQI